MSHFSTALGVVAMAAWTVLEICGCSEEAADGTSKSVTLLNVSYDPTRELYEELNAAFAKKWLAEKGQVVTINQSHGGSGKQARAVIEGLEADVVTLALGRDIDAIADKAHLLPADWQARLPAQSAPFTSTIVLVVRQGNPKHIKDWNDLIRDDVVVIAANPKTSGGARWSYLAAWSYALAHNDGDEAAATAFVKQLFGRVPVLDTGARASMTTFAERDLGDVLIAWESEAQLLVRRPGAKFSIVVPSLSMRAEPPVAVLDRNVDKHGTRAVAQAYLEFLYSEEAQEIGVKHYLRPTSAAVRDRHATEWPALTLVGIDELHGWSEVQHKHFDDAGIFDSLVAAR